MLNVNKFLKEVCEKKPKLYEIKNQEAINLLEEFTKEFREFQNYLIDYLETEKSIDNLENRGGILTIPSKDKNNHFNYSSFENEHIASDINSDCSPKMDYEPVKTYSTPRILPSFADLPMKKFTMNLPFKIKEKIQKFKTKSNPKIHKLNNIKTTMKIRHRFLGIF